MIPYLYACTVCWHVAIYFLLIYKNILPLGLTQLSKNAKFSHKTAITLLLRIFKLSHWVRVHMGIQPQQLPHALAEDKWELEVVGHNQEVELALDSQEVDLAVDNQEVELALDRQEVELALDNQEVELAGDKQEQELVVDKQ